MMARKSKIEELTVAADPWNLKLKPALAMMDAAAIDRQLQRTHGTSN